MISEVPLILCRDEDTAMIIQAALHSHLTREPPVMVVGEEEWPEKMQCSAALITPIQILGSGEPKSFSLPDIERLTKSTKKVLSSIMRYKMANDGKFPPIRWIAAAAFGEDTPLSKRGVRNAIKELERAKFLFRPDEQTIDYRTNFGRWRPDPSIARSAGLEVEEYER